MEWRLERRLMELSEQDRGDDVKGSEITEWRGKRYR
jgi:hypothetical protein